MLRQLIQRIKACDVLYVVCVDTVNTGVCGFYTTLHTLYTGPLTSPGGKAHCSHQSCGLAVHQSEEAALFTFEDLSTTMVIVGKTHSQSPILNS